MMLDKIKRALAENIVRLMDARRGGESRIAFAKRTGVGDGTLGRIMYGTGNPRLDTLVQLAGFFRVKPWELLIPGDQQEDAATPSPIDFNLLAQATRLVAEEQAKIGRLIDPGTWSTAIVMAYRSLEKNIGTDSAKSIVADLLATMRHSENETSVRGRTSK